MSKLRHPRLTPQTLQMEATECGAASLAMILAYYGSFPPRAELRKACRISREGSRASDLLRAAKTYGLAAKGWRASRSKLRELPLPAVLFWEDRHFLVLEAWESTGGAWLNDPAFGHRHVSDEELAQGFSGVVLTMEPGPDFRPTAAPPGVVRWSWRQFAEEPQALAWLLLGAALLALPSLLVAICLRIFVDEYYLQAERHWLPVLLGAMATATALQVGLTVGLRRLLLRWEERQAKREGEAVLHQLLSLSPAERLARDPAELASRLELATASARRLFRDIGGWLIYLPIALLSLAWMSLAGPWMWMAVILLGALAVGLALDREGRDAEAVEGILQARFSSTVLRGLSLPDALRFGGEAGFLARLNRLREQLAQSRTRQAARLTKRQMGLRLQADLALVVILGVGAWEVMTGRLSIGSLMAFLVLWGPLNRWLLKTFALRRWFHQLALYRERLADLPAAVRPQSGGLRFEKLELRNVTFAPSSSTPPLLRDLSLTIAPAQRIALTGGAGSGKSTLLRLLTGLIEPDKGEVWLNGAPVAPERFCEVGGWSEADTALPAGRAVAHLRVGCSALSAKEETAAWKAAGLRESDRPRKVAELSDGERQLLEMARLFAREPRLLLLDDATRDLDAPTARALAAEWRARGVAWLWATDDPEILNASDEIWRLADGTITQEVRR